MLDIALKPQTSSISSIDHIRLLQPSIGCDDLTPTPNHSSSAISYHSIEPDITATNARTQNLCVDSLDWIAGRHLSFLQTSTVLDNSREPFTITSDADEITGNADGMALVNTELKFNLFHPNSDRSTNLGSFDSSITDMSDFTSLYGYGMVDAAEAVADVINTSPFPDVLDLGGADWGRDRVQAPEVWNQGFTGDDIVIAVLDTGVDYTHVDLDDNIWANSVEIANNGIDDDGNGYVDDVMGWDFVSDDADPIDEHYHGTHVAGIVAAENNGIGITGVAPDASIMPVRVIGNGAEQDIVEFLIDVADGIRYAVDNGADIINMSLGYDPIWYGGTLPPEAQLIEDAIQYASEQGTVIIMAAGNEGASHPAPPADIAANWGIAVGATNFLGQAANFSNRAGYTPIDYVVAPGVNVYSTVPNNEYDTLSGTSMAAPHVAGVAALIMDANPNLTASDVEEVLTETADAWPLMT